MRHGRRGILNVPVGSSTNTPRATKWSHSRMFSPPCTGATGMRSSLASAHDLGGGVLRRPRVDDRRSTRPSALWRSGVRCRTRRRRSGRGARSAAGSCRTARGCWCRSRRSRRASARPTASRSCGVAPGDRRAADAARACTRRSCSPRWSSPRRSRSRCARRARSAARAARPRRPPSPRTCPPATRSCARRPGTARRAPSPRPTQTARLGLHDELGGRPLGVRARCGRTGVIEHTTRPGCASSQRCDVELRRREALDRRRRRRRRAPRPRDRRARRPPSASRGAGTGTARRRLDVDGRAARRPRAPRVTARRLDLHDVGAGVGEQARCSTRPGCRC